MNEFSKYERARIIGARALQISMGAPIMLSLNDEELKKLRYSTVEIAKLEFERGLVPITVKKPMPSETRKEAAAKPFDQTRLE